MGEAVAAGIIGLIGALIGSAATFAGVIYQQRQAARLQAAFALRDTVNGQRGCCCASYSIFRPSCGSPKKASLRKSRTIAAGDCENTWQSSEPTPNGSHLAAFASASQRTPPSST
ncbi:hypothetical protein [Streptomyces sp. NPDC093970]|uniref:hypothetical protein n=1 Tax=Streptomyces sp. NPDC093970 TaxID=3155076 RepID=UPI003430F9B5